jgi:hypothetical protein
MRKIAMVMTCLACAALLMLLDQLDPKRQMHLMPTDPLPPMSAEETERLLGLLVIMSPETTLMVTMRLWCVEADYCMIRVRDSTVHLFSIHNEREMDVIDTKLPRDSQVLSVLASLCGHQACEIEGYDDSVTIRQYGRDAAMFVRNDDGRLSTHILAPAMARE